MTPLRAGITDFPQILSVQNLMCSRRDQKMLIQRRSVELKVIVTSHSISCAYISQFCLVPPKSDHNMKPLSGVVCRRCMSISLATETLLVKVDC